MKNIFKITFLVFTVFCLFYFILPVQAQTFGNEQLTNFGVAAGYGEAPLPEVIGNIVKIGLSLLGLIAVIIMIAGGFIWMTSGGVVDKVTKAKKIISSGLIGLLVIVFAYAMVTFVMSQLFDVTGPAVEGEDQPCTPGLCCGPGLRCSTGGSCNISDPDCSLPPDAFRIRKIETTHGGYEENYNQDVYLCSAVQPIFNNSVDDTVIQDLAQSNELRIEGVTGTWQTRNNTLIFKHPELFAENASYEAYFPKVILDNQGRILQACLASGGCVSAGNYFIWNFNTGTTVDTIPPEITSTYPIFNPVDPNYPDQGISTRPVIEVSFSESIDITTVADENNYPIDTNIWLSKLDEQNGVVVEILSRDVFEIIGGDNGFEIHLRDENLLEPFVWYRIHVEGVEDLCLNAMATAVEWEFQTNDQSPGFSSQYPTGSAVCSDSDITVVFNTQMYDNLIRFEITGGDNFLFDIRGSELNAPYEKIVPGGIFKITDPGDPINNHFRVFTFDPDDNLQSESDYQVTVLTDLVIDQQGTLLSNTWNFTTATMGECFCIPWISRLEPAQGSRGECITLYGQCFEGTVTQPALPIKIEFILNGTPTQTSINGFSNDYLTTEVPILYSEEDRPEVQATIEYDSGDQLVSNLVEFYVDSSEMANGPCLFSINPSVGYSDETETNLSGIRFGAESAISQVVFYDNNPAVYQIWGDQEVRGALVPSGAEDGLVYVETEQGTSNGLPFDILQHPGGPGEACQEATFCPSNPDYNCTSPVYECLYQVDDDCRCCCDPILNSCNAPLECLADQGSCTGENRGLCCGCESDSECGGDLGCGFLDLNQCCHPRPEIISALPLGPGVCVNSAIQVNFDKPMDELSLNENNIILTKLSLLIESKLGINYADVEGISCLDQSDVFTGRCTVNWWDYSFNIPAYGDYQLYVQTSNDIIGITDFGEDGVCVEPGVQHHIKVFVDEVERGELCADAELSPQISAISLGAITAGEHLIRLEWDNDWFNWYDGAPYDSNIRIYQVDLRQEIPEEEIGVHIVINEENDQVNLLPVNCDLDQYTGYKVELTGGINGSGIRDSLGVSMDDYAWQFVTGPENNTCEISEIIVSPDSAIVESFENNIVYTAQTYDINSNPVCVSEFFWASDNIEIALISQSQGLETTVSPAGGNGELVADISATAYGTSGIGQFTSILSPPIITSLSPDSGTNNPAIPTYVTIIGDNFGDEQEDSYVLFGFYEAEIGCQNWSNTEIIAIVPPDLTFEELYSVTVISPDQGQSNEMFFEITDEFHPAICQLRPNQGGTGTLITIEGDNFGNQQGSGYVVFGEGGSDPQTISEIEENDWFNTEIVITVPEVPESTASVVVYVPSPIEDGNPLKSSNSVSFYKPVMITRITPDKGPKGTWITIAGENFGPDPGQVYFKYDDIDYLADALPAQCPSTWTDKEIVVVVPDSLPEVLEEQDFYDVQIYIETALGLQSDLVEWEVNKEVVAPGLCEISPNEELQPNDIVNLIGARFDPIITETARRLIFYQDKEATSLEWTSDTEINNAVLPSGTVSGDVYIEKDIVLSCHDECNGILFGESCFGILVEVCDENQIRSNSLFINFASYDPPDALGLPQVIEDSTCLDTPQSPSPRYLASQVCRNAVISARFDMDVSGLSDTNIIVEKCNLGSEEFNYAACTSVNGSISLAGFGYQGFVFTPDILLDQNYWYQVTLKSGETGIIDTVNNYQLDGNKDGIEDGSPNDDYVWYFKTKNELEICSAQAVMILEQEPEGLIIESGTKDYSALSVGPDCQGLRQDTFTWDWLSTELVVATVAQQTPVYTATATAVDLGETEIQATATPLVGDPVMNSVNLIVAGYPLVENSQPTEVGACLNSAIKATFDQLMDRSSISENTIKFYKWTGLWTDITSIIDISTFNNGEDKTEVNISAGLLDSNQPYRVVILGGEDGVKSFYGVNMETDFGWEFTSSDQICTLASVEIEPRTINFTEVNASEELIAYAYDNEGYEILSNPGVYAWTWIWESSDPAVVSLSGSVLENETATAEDRNGRIQITATANIVDSDPVISVVGQTDVNVFICEVPWFFEDAVGPGSAPNTQFKLGYCRGDLAQAEADRLPELSAALIEGSNPLIKEFLFSVGDSGDIIGLKVFNNPKRLSVLNWYEQNVPNPGKPSSFVIDNYYALREGRTTYVGATNLTSDANTFTNPQHSGSYLWPNDATAQQYCIDDEDYNGFESYSTTGHGGSLSRYNDGWEATGGGARISTITCANQGVYTYVYLISYNDGANSETVEIFNQILYNWEFNINLDNYFENKLKLQNDLLRLYNFREIKDKLNEYFQEQNEYPTLGGGTYVLGKSNSIWPSWTKSLSKDLGESLPVDPINEFNGPCAGCIDEPDFQCENTCYNSNTQIFEIPDGSHVYQYYAPEESGCVGEYYTLSVNLEYGDGNITWKGEEDIITVQADSLGDFNYIYYSPERPICGDGIVQCGEECDSGAGGNNSQHSCYPPSSTYCPSGSMTLGFNPLTTCEALGYETAGTGFLECNSCSWSGGSCIKKIDGEICEGNENCLSGSCADGVCCDTACTGNCQYCGEGSGGIAGVCHDVSSGNDPRNVCNDTSGCLTGNCNGSGFCMEYYTSGDRNCPECKTCDGASSGICVNKTNNTQDTVGDALCQDTCKRCYGGVCTNQTTSQDLFNDCELTWNACDGDCVRIGSDGLCDSGGVCDTNDRTGNIVSGSVCTGAGNITGVSASDYCGSSENNCSDNSCSGSRWYRSCNGSGACRSIGDHVGGYLEIFEANENYVFNTNCGQDLHNATNYCSSIINDCTDAACSGYRYYRGCDGDGVCKTDATGAYQQTVYPNTGKTLTASCGLAGNTLCNYSSYNACDLDCVKKRDELRCSAGHSCSYDVGNDTAIVAENKVCNNGAEVNVSSTYYCGTGGACTSGDCSGTIYYRGCTASGICKTNNTGAASATVNASSGNILTASCGQSTAECAVCHQCDGGDCDPVTGAGAQPYLGCGSGNCCSGNCSDLNTDTNNCGSCGTACSATNATGNCNSGTCSYTCNSGWENCDGNWSNGCETNLNTSSNCGSCGTVCSAATNATGTCNSGTCSYTCDYPWDNCDSNWSNGCEVHLNSNINNCGSCGNVCSVDNAQGTCPGGDCSYVCNTDWGNCDNEWWNGCEINLDSNDNHCGDCDTSCWGAWYCNRDHCDQSGGGGGGS